MCSTLYCWPRSRTSSRASAVGRSKRSNGSASATILRISSSMRGKSSSRDRRRRIDVVIEAVLERRAEGELRAGEEAHDGAGHDVGAAVPQHVERFGVLRSVRTAKECSPPPCGQFAVEIDDGTVHLGGDGGLGQAFADGLGHVARPGAGGNLADGAVGNFRVGMEGFSRKG